MKFDRGSFHTTLLWLDGLRTDASRPRNRRLLLTGTASLGAQAVSFGAQLIIIPTALHYLGVERFGLYMTLASLLVAIPAIDLGTGNALMNVLATAYGRDNRDEMRVALSSASVVLSALIFALIVSFALFYHWIPWNSLLSVTSPLARSETRGAVAILGTLAILNIPGSTLQRTQLALQEGYVASVFTALGSVFGLLFLLVVIRLGLGLPWLVAVLAGGPLIATIMNYLFFFGWRHGDLRPVYSRCTRPMTRRLLQMSGLFLLLQLSWIISYQLDRFVIARLLGPPSVSSFAIGATLFTSISSIVSLFVQPLWPAYGEARARRDTAWIRRALRLSMTVSGTACLVFGLGLIALKPLIEKYWLRNAVSLDFPLMLLFALWTAIESTGSAFATMLSGTGHLTEQLFLAVFFTATCITAKVVLVSRLGPAGILIGAISSYLVITFPICLVIARRLVLSGEL